MNLSLHFENTSKDRFNDQYEPREMLSLQRTLYRFRLVPQNTHWRFGVIITDNPQLPDSTAGNFDRYDFTKYQYLQVNVGTISADGLLEHASLIQLTDMQQPPFYETNDYASFSEIELTLEPLPMNLWGFTCNYYLANGQRKSISGKIELRFTKFIFFAAWCDFNPYELNCECTIEDTVTGVSKVGLLGSTFEGERHFGLGENIVVRLGNLLDDYSLANMNEIVLPACTTGKLSRSTEKN